MRGCAESVASLGRSGAVTTPFGSGPRGWYPPRACPPFVSQGAFGTGVAGSAMLEG